MTRALLALMLTVVVTACVTPGEHAARPPQAAGASFLEVDGAWLRVVERGEGDGVPVVLVHGYGSRLEAWKEMQPSLADGRRTLAYDQRGFGLSERPDGAYGPDRHAQDLLALLDAAGIERAVLVGHSYGGGVAARAAQLAPERVAGLVLMDAFLLDEQVPTSFRWAQVPVLGEVLFGAFYKEVPGEKYLLAFHDRERFVTLAALDEMKALMARPGSTYAALETVRGMDYDAIEGGYDAIRSPALIIWGADDRVTPLAQGEAIAKTFDGARFVVLPGCGHMPSWERPKSALAALAPFLDDVDARARATPALPAGDPADTARHENENEAGADETGSEDAAALVPSVDNDGSAE